MYQKITLTFKLWGPFSQNYLIRRYPVLAQVPQLKSYSISYVTDFHRGVRSWWLFMPKIDNCWFTKKIPNKTHHAWLKINTCITNGHSYVLIMVLSKLIKCKPYLTILHVKCIQNWASFNKYSYIIPIWIQSCKDSWLCVCNVNICLQRNTMNRKKDIRKSRSYLSTVIAPLPRSHNNCDMSSLKNVWARSAQLTFFRRQARLLCLIRVSVGLTEKSLGSKCLGHLFTSPSLD